MDSASDQIQFRDNTGFMGDPACSRLMGPDELMQQFDHPNLLQFKREHGTAIV